MVTKRESRVGGACVLCDAHPGHRPSVRHLAWCSVRGFVEWRIDTTTTTWRNGTLSASPAFTQTPPDVPTLLVNTFFLVTCNLLPISLLPRRVNLSLLALSSLRSRADGRSAHSFYSRSRRFCICSSRSLPACCCCWYCPRRRKLVSASSRHHARRQAQACFCSCCCCPVSIEKGFQEALNFPRSFCSAQVFSQLSLLDNSRFLKPTRAVGHGALQFRHLAVRQGRKVRGRIGRAP